MLCEPQHEYEMTSLQYEMLWYLTFTNLISQSLERGVGPHLSCSYSRLLQPSIHYWQDKSTNRPRVLTSMFHKQFLFLQTSWREIFHTKTIEMYNMNDIVTKARLCNAFIWTSDGHLRVYAPYPHKSYFSANMIIINKNIFQISYFSI